MYSLLQDFRFAFRQLMRTPGFALTAIVSLALGIGATTAVFSVVYAVLMDPYPYANVNRMAHLAAKDKSDEGTYLGLTGPQLQQVRELPMIEDLIAYTGWNLTITGHDLPEDVNGTYFTSNAFNFFGVPAYLGRGLLPSDAIDGQDPQPVVVLGYKFWQRHFNADPTVLGRTIQLVHKNYVIVGVAAPRFAWNDGDVYLPLKIAASDPLSYSTSMRLKPGISHEAVNAALEPLIQQYAHDIPSHFPQHFEVQVRGFNDGFVHDLGGTLALLFTAVALLLAIGCGNVSILLLARGAARQHEFAVRSAIGAGRARIIRQLLTESLLLSLTGAALGVALAYKTVAFIVALLPESSFPHEAAIQINLPVLLFSVGVALLTGILFGLGPAFQISSPDVSQVMQSTRRIAGGVTGRRIFNLLIGGQIALTLLMLAGAGTAAESFFRLIHTNLGYEPRNIMSVGIPIHENTYKTWAERSTYFEQLRAKAAQVSGVTMTAISSNATPPSNGFKSPLEILGQPASDQREALLNLVSPEYFPALRIPLLQGRIWDATENRNAAHVVVINQTMARQFFPNGDAVGHSLKVPVPPAEPPFRLIAPGIQDSWLQIVGVVADDLRRWP
jgi:putative ABC transport system permease protein